MPFRRSWSSAHSICHSKLTHGSKWKDGWSTTNHMHLMCTQSWTGAKKTMPTIEVRRINMSVQFGQWNFDGKPIDRDYLERVNRLIAPYGPDDGGHYAKQNVSFLYRAFHTTKESRRETQPHITQAGAVITWDGRLDNRDELIRSLCDVLTVSSTDISIVAAAYEQWGTECFAKLVGDWALSIWDATAHSLILAKDPTGTRHLYY